MLAWRALACCALASCAALLAGPLAAGPMLSPAQVHLQRVEVLVDREQIELRSLLAIAPTATPSAVSFLELTLQRPRSTSCRWAPKGKAPPPGESTEWQPIACPDAPSAPPLSPRPAPARWSSVQRTVQIANPESLGWLEIASVFRRSAAVPGHRTERVWLPLPITTEATQPLSASADLEVVVQLPEELQLIGPLPSQLRRDRAAGSRGGTRYRALLPIPVRALSFALAPEQSWRLDLPRLAEGFVLLVGGGALAGLWYAVLRRRS